MVSRLVYGGVAAAGMVGGFMLDRSIANTPYRVEQRIPDIARTEIRRDSYDEDPTSKLPGKGSNSAVFWAPIAVGSASILSLVGVAALVRTDRIWQQTIAGRGAIGGSIVGASMLTGVIGSRAVLG